MAEEYKEIYLPSHHRAKTNGCLDEHIVIAESVIGRELKDGEVVHHKDRKRRNNDPSNLMVFTSSSAHARYHKGGTLIKLSDGTYDCAPSSKRPKKSNHYVYPIIFYYGECKYCGKPLKTKGADKCQDCLHKLQRRCEWPTKEQLDQDVLELKTNLAIAKKYGVSNVTIAKWRKNFK